MWLWVAWYGQQTLWWLTRLVCTEAGGADSQLRSVVAVAMAEVA